MLQSLFEAPKARDEMVPSPVRKEDGAKHARRVLEEALFGRSPSQAELDSLGEASVISSRHHDAPAARRLTTDD